MDTAAPSYGPPCPLSFIQREAAALKIEPPFHGRIEMCLLYDGFFSFAVVRQIDYLISGNTILPATKA